MDRVLVLGGYGNFGKRIVRALVKKEISTIIGGRNLTKCAELEAQLNTPLAQSAAIDVNNGFESSLVALGPKVVINTCGPFQGADYEVAKACARNGVNYIDLADGRDFVSGISALDEIAKKNNCAIISGASTVPALSSAVIEHFKSEFRQIECLKFGISPGQKAERGLATTAGILSYVGKRLAPFAGHDRAYGWQDIYAQKYPELGTRFMANCEIPDLDLLPAKYGIRDIQFSAGLELGLLHFGLWFLSFFVRFGLPLNLDRHAKIMLDIANWFDKFGSADGGMHIILQGINHEGKQVKKTWFIVAKDGDGPQIPTVPAILLAEKIVKNGPYFVGAKPCVSMIELSEYLLALEAFNVRTFET
jgi:NAD(P)-dependent dehydrogenase (short-subunit alcohol dehydrogenase family)